MPAQVNATLTAVRSATAATGGRDDWDQPAGVEPAGAGAPKWSGEADAYYTEASAFVAGAAGANITATRRLIIDSAVARDAGIDTDDVLAFTFGGEEREARAVNVAVRELAGIPGHLQTTRIELEAT